MSRLRIFSLKLILRGLAKVVGVPRLADGCRTVREKGWRLPLRWGEGLSCWESALWTLAFSPRPGGRLVLGVRKEGEKLHAHAWVEYPADEPDQENEFQKLGSL